MKTASVRSKLASVIIPVFNRPELVNQTIDSVFFQHYRPVELILVDDGSDPPFECESLIPPAGVEIRCTRLSKNSGPGAAREVGRRMASGEYLCYLDSDDLLDPRIIQAQVESLINNPEAGMCYSAAIEFDTLPLDDTVRTYRCSDQEFKTILPQLLIWRPWPTGACLWRRWAADRIGPWLPGRIWEDYEYDCRAGCFDIPITHVSDHLFFRRRHDENLSQEDVRIIRLLRSYSLIQIGENLDRFKKLGDETIRTRLYRALYNTGTKLIIDGELTAGSNCLDLITRLRTIRAEYKFFVFLISKFSRVFHSDIVVRISRRFFDRLLALG